MARNAILIVADDRQFPPAVFLAHCLAALRGNRDVDIVLATDWLPGLIEAATYNGPFELLDVRNLHAELDLPQVGYFTRATFYSLFVPALLARRYDRLLYLDVDTYPESDRVFALFDLDMGENAFAAVRDLSVPFHPSPYNGAEIMATLKVPPERRLGAKYLNSGVILIDLPAFRRTKFEEQAVKLIRQRRIELRFPDQTVFNAVLRSRWLELSPAFNMVTRAWASFVRAFAPPVIVHFTGPYKPWHRVFIDPHPVREELAEFLKGTPWRTFIADINPPPILLPGGTLPPPPELQTPIWPPEAEVALVRYLRETAFADVEQGLTTLHPEALPRSPESAET